MGKVLSLIIPFLMEMLFGKKDDKVVLTRGQKIKRQIVYVIIAASFGLNYWLGGRLYNISVNYITLKKEKAALELRVVDSEANKAKADQLSASLEFCMRIAFDEKKKGPGRSGK